LKYHSFYLQSGSGPVADPERDASTTSVQHFENLG